MKIFSIMSVIVSIQLLGRWRIMKNQYIGENCLKKEALDSSLI